MASAENQVYDNAYLLTSYVLRNEPFAEIFHMLLDFLPNALYVVRRLH